MAAAGKEGVTVSLLSAEALRLILSAESQDTARSLVHIKTTTAIHCSVRELVKHVTVEFALFLCRTGPLTN